MLAMMKKGGRSIHHDNAGRGSRINNNILANQSKGDTERGGRVIKITISADTKAEAEWLEEHTLKAIKVERIKRPLPDKDRRHRIYITGEVKKA